MVDRVIAYDGALPQTTDVLNAGKFAMVGQAFQNRAMLGSSTVIAGLACTPTSPIPDLHVTIGVGSIYQLDPTDTAAYGDLGTDNNNILKQGILQAPAVLTITPPATVGFSQVYLVQAELQNVDAGQMVLSYFNSANPAQPFAGPANSGTSNFTTRTCQCTIALKAGAAAATGSQTTPAPDVGFVGLYAITVVNGQTQITSPNIVQQPSAPFFPTLPQVPYDVQKGVYSYAGQDTGAVNAYVIAFAAGQPIPKSYVAGMRVVFKALNANTGASTINVNGLGLVAIKRATGTALSAADINSGQVVELTHDGTNFQMANYLGAGATSNTNTVVGIPYVVDTGAVNALVATYSPAITSGQQIAGLFISIKLANTITGATTINVSGLGLKNILTGDLANPPNGVYVAGETLLLVYDGTQYQIVNTSSLTYRKPTGNTTIFVNGGIGNDANDGVSNTSGHALRTIQAGVNLAFGYAPSQFTITIVVEPGTYNESVSTPSYAGPNLVIDGLSAASVTVNSGSSDTFTVTGPNTLTVKNVTGVNTRTPQSGGMFIAINGATMVTANTVSNTPASVFVTENNGVLFPGTHTFSSSCYAFFNSQYGGSIQLASGNTYTISAPVSVTATAISLVNANIQAALTPPNFVNPSFVSGPRFACSVNGSIAVNGAGLNYFPGTIAGSTSSGGQYSP